MRFEDEHAIDSYVTVVDVKENFKWLTYHYLAQGILSFLCSFYQVIAILVWNPLLRYRMYVSRANKIVICYIIYLLALTWSYRYSPEGQLCSGDQLTWAQKRDPKAWEVYMIKIGNILRGYIYAIYVLLGSAATAGVFMFYSLKKAF